MVVHYWRVPDVGADHVLHDPASGSCLRRTLRGEIEA
jgi:hypothetical protein